jgi:hypothetical protein
MKGEMERGLRAFYRRSRGEETAGELKELKRGVTARSGLVTGGISVRRKKKVSVLTRGSHQSVRGREKEWYRFGFFPGLARPVWAPDRPKWAGLFLSLFFCAVSFLIFCFLISFITFARTLQFKPNFFQRFSKRMHNILSQ